MAGEIIALEKNGSRMNFAFLYTIPPAYRIEIGGTGTTGTYPVPTPTFGLSAELLAVLTSAEKDKLDSGEAVIRPTSFDLTPGQTKAQVIADAQSLYADQAQIALEEYTSRYAYIGLRIDKAV